MKALPLIFVLFIAGSWLTNFCKFVSSDFDTPLKREVVHGVGVFVPPVSLITCWFTFNEEE